MLLNLDRPVLYKHVQILHSCGVPCNLTAHQEQSNDLCSRFFSKYIITNRKCTNVLIYQFLIHRDFFEEALDAIPKPINKDDYARIDMLLVKVKTSMHLQLSCLANDATNNTPINTLIADPNRVTTV